MRTFRGKFLLDKRGQIAIFIILGFLIILSFILLIVAEKIAITDPASVHRNTLIRDFDKKALENYMQYCIEKTAIPAINKIGEYGATLNESDLTLHNKTWYTTPYRLVCLAREGSKQCAARIIAKSKIEQELSQEIINNLQSCINTSYFTERKYEITYGTPSLATTIGKTTIDFYLKYPITLTKETETIQIEDFSTKIEHPLGLAHTLMIEIINDETTKKGFDKEKFMQEQEDLAIITKEKPYPFVLYTINMSTQDNKGYIIKFGIEHHNTAQNPQVQNGEKNYGCCYVQGVCQSQTSYGECANSKGTYITSTMCTCSSLFRKNEKKSEEVSNLSNKNIATKTNIASDQECNNKNQGESWCTFIDGVGGRSILKSCWDGKLLIEPCRDYFEEICIMQPTGKSSTAYCKENRFTDCISCNNSACCENDALRDCIWLDMPYSAIADSPVIQCVPKRGGGIATKNSDNICSMATGYTICQGKTCGDDWTAFKSKVCSSLGDCGINANTLGIITTDGFLESDLHSSPPKIKTKLADFSANIETNQLKAKKNNGNYHIIPSLVSATLRYLADTAYQRNTILDYSFCSPWQAPVQSYTCEKCIENNTKQPCSRYLCESLGQNCKYSEEKGIPLCTNKKIKEKNEEITIIFNSEKKSQGFSNTITSPLSAAKTIVDKQEFEMTGYEIIEPFAPHEKISFSLMTSEPTMCKITYTPSSLFAKTAPIWLDKPTFNNKHDVTFNIPEKIVLPEQLQNRLNIENINKLYFAILKNDQTLKNKLDDQTYYMLKKAAVYLQENAEDAAYFEAITTLLEENKFLVFVKCIDEKGNENTKPIAIKFSIHNKSIDLVPPIIVGTIPENKSTISLTPYTLTIFSNEPAQCKMSESNIPYENMEEIFNCVVSPYELSSQFNGSYACQKTTSITSPYVLCKDNPAQKEQYQVQIRESLIVQETQNNSNFTQIEENKNQESNQLNTEKIIIQNTPSITTLTHKETGQSDTTIPNDGTGEYYNNPENNNNMQDSENYLQSKEKLMQIAQTIKQKTIDPIMINVPTIVIESFQLRNNPVLEIQKEGLSLLIVELDWDASCTYEKYISLSKEYSTTQMNCIAGDLKDLGSNNIVNAKVGPKLCYTLIHAGNYNSKITCSKPSEFNQNTQEQPTYLEFSVDESFRIISIFPEENSIIESEIITLSALVNSDIVEDEVSCGYSINQIDTDNPDENYQMYSVGDFQFVKEVIIAEPGEYSATIECTNKQGIISKKTTLFTVLEKTNRVSAQI